MSGTHMQQENLRQMSQANAWRCGLLSSAPRNHREGKIMAGASRNVRGSSYDRKKRRDWLMAQFGNGRTIPCFHCGKRMRTKMEVDRYPICGHDGGRYVRGNIVPSCARCNGKRCTTKLKCRQGAPG